MPHVLHYLGNVGMTGVETFVLMLAACQQRAGVRVSITCALEGREELVHSCDALGISVVPFPTLASPGGMRGKAVAAATRVSRAASLGRFLRKHQVDVLHLHPVGIAGLDAMAAAALYAVRTVTTHHATLKFFEPYRTRTSDLTFALEKRVARWIVCPYAEASREMIAHGMPEERVVTVPFCVDLQKFGDVQRAPRAQGAEFRFLISARIVEGKGHAELFEAMGQLKQRVPQARCWVLGGGPLEEGLREKVRALGLQETVKFLGKVPNEQVPALMAEVGALVLPSFMQGETFPVSLLEAMAMGLPCIGTRWFGIPDIIRDGVTGSLVPPRDVPALAAALESLAQNPELARRMGAAGRERARTEFSADVVMKRYTELYQGVGRD